MKNGNKTLLSNFIVRCIEDDYVLWFAQSNHYVQVKQPVWDAVNLVCRYDDLKKATDAFSGLYQISVDESHRFVSEILAKFNTLDVVPEENTKEPVRLPAENRPEPFLVKTYKIGGHVFSLSYSHPYYYTIVHPLFEQHITDEKATLFFEIYLQGTQLWLIKNGLAEWQWDINDSHFLKGRLYLEVLQFLFDKTEQDWMTVMHASSVSNGKSAVLLTADSGSGKSTFAALCKAHGLQILSDDFVPIDLENKHVFPFPSALSVKPGAVDLLLPHFPELHTAVPYNFNHKKDLRFIYPNSFDEIKNIQVPAVALIFIKYNKDVAFELKPISTLEALRHVFDQAWLAPKQANAEAFLDWISQLQCYQMQYANTEKAIDAVQRMMQDDK